MVVDLESSPDDGIRLVCEEDLHHASLFFSVIREIRAIRGYTFPYSISVLLRSVHRS
jgi:hypothetical protein